MEPSSPDTMIDSIGSPSNSLHSSSAPSPGSSMVASPLILEPRDQQRGNVAGSIGTLGGLPVYVMTSQHQEIKTLEPRPVAGRLLMENHLTGAVQGQTRIVVMEEPEEKFRFRYKSEMQGTHGCIHGKTYGKKNKKFPMIQVLNVPSDVDTVKLRVALYTNETPKNHHVHKLMWKTASDTEQNFVEIDVGRSQLFQHMWQGLGIIHTSRKYIDQVLYDRIKKVYMEKKGAKINFANPDLSDAENIKLKKDAHELGKEVVNKLNTVVLGFEAFRVDKGVYRPLCPMAFSHPINNLKNPSTGDLKICRMSAFSGSVEGGEEVFIFIERVKKGDIKVRFFELDKDEERVWWSFAEFQENDVHHQYAVAFKTPQYVDTTVEQDVHVFFELYRPSDEAISEPKAFRYKPSEDVRVAGVRKRRRIMPNFLPHRQMNGIENDVNMVNLSLDSDMIPVTVEDHQPSNNNNLTSIIENLLNNQDYVNTLDEPTPYDHLSQQGFYTTKSDIVPDLLMFSKPFHQDFYPEQNSPVNVSDSIAMDSASVVESDSVERRTESVQVDSGEAVGADLAMKVSLSLSQALHQLNTSSDKDAVFEKIYRLLGITTADGDNTLHTAVINKQQDALKFILDVSHKMKFAEILNESNSAGNSPLHLAVLSNQPDLARLLIEYQASPNSVDHDGNSPVHLTIKHRQLDILAMLLNDTVDLNLANNAGQFPIHLAVRAGLLEAVRVLDEHGTDVDARDKVAGKTALYMATEDNKVDIIKYLVREAKADVDCKSFNGTTSITVAKEKSNEEALKILNNLEENSDYTEESSMKSVEDLTKEEMDNLRESLSRDKTWTKVALDLGLGNLVPVIQDQEDPVDFFIQYLKTKQMKIDPVIEAVSKINMDE